MKKHSLFLIILLALMSTQGFAQKERKFIRRGNDQFDGKKYQDSEIQYRKALEKKNNSFGAAFNLGDALFKQKKYDEALKQFENLAATEKNPENLGKIYHNIGNTLLTQNKIDESIEAYKKSLRNHPNSRETKYNLEYARLMKKKQEQQKQKQKQNQKNNKDQKNKDQKNKDQQNKDKKNQDKKNQDKKNQDKKDQDKKKQDQQKKDQQNKGDKDKSKQQQQQKGKISKQDAKRLLEALQNDEKKVQEKVQKARAKAKRKKKAKIKKDW